jgi:hypothetical protein
MSSVKKKGLLRMIQSTKIFIFLLLVAIPQMGWTYFSNLDSGELVPQDQYRLIFEPQLGHYNITTHFDAGITDSTQLRISIGAGEDGTHFDFFYKSIPYPDFEDQPAIGYKIGTVFVSDKSTNLFSIRFMPLLSKNITIKQNRWTPYASLPLTVSTQQSSSKTPIHLVLGTEINLPSAPDMQFGFEVGSALKDSFSYVSGFISFYFEPSEKESDLN